MREQTDVLHDLFVNDSAKSGGGAKPEYLKICGELTAQGVKDHYADKDDDGNHKYGFLHDKAVNAGSGEVVDIINALQPDVLVAILRLEIGGEGNEPGFRSSLIKTSSFFKGADGTLLSLVSTPTNVHDQADIDLIQNAVLAKINARKSEVAEGSEEYKDCEALAKAWAPGVLFETEKEAHKEKTAVGVEE